MRKAWCIVLSFLLCCGMFSPVPSRAADPSSMEDIFLSPEIPVLGVLTRMLRKNVPDSVTTITEEDIRLTPARNIYDLMEVYVPGALWMNHSEGPHMGIRGIISDRNTKFLLLVNGRNLNQNAHNGAADELGN